MAKKKKKVKKKTSKKTKKKKSKPKKSSVSAQKVQIQMQPVLVDNFVSLQRVMVNLATKFDTLNSQLKELLDLFELSAKSLAKKGIKLETGKESDEKVIKKLNELSEQNKVIARGLTLMHEVSSQEPSPMQSAPAPIMTPPRPKPLPGYPKLPTMKEEEYKKSAPVPQSEEKEETSQKKK